MGVDSDRQEIGRSMEEVHALFPILDQRKRQVSKTLSGGEQQMLAIGRAFMANPRLLLVDEVSTGLMPIFVDKVSQEVIQRWITPVNDASPVSSVDCTARVMYYVAAIN